MAYPQTFVLLQYGTDPFAYIFEDLEKRPAFTVERVARDPNLIVKLSRRDEWALQHPDIMGPRNSYFYFGPGMLPGHLAYGNAEPLRMMALLKKKKEPSLSRYFNAQNGREWKWKLVAPGRLECSDSRTVIAVWEAMDGSRGYDARLLLTADGLAIVTEVLTTLTLNHMALELKWQW